MASERAEAALSISSAELMPWPSQVNLSARAISSGNKILMKVFFVLNAPVHNPKPEWSVKAILKMLEIPRFRFSVGTITEGRKAAR